MSPEAKELIKISKQKHKVWDLKGRQRGNDQSYVELKQAKYNARKILRKEREIEKENFYHQLEQNLSTKNFYKFIKRNLNTANSNTPVILHENREIS